MKLEDIQSSAWVDVAMEWLIYAALIAAFILYVRST